MSGYDRRGGDPQSAAEPVTASRPSVPGSRSVYEPESRLPPVGADGARSPQEAVRIAGGVRMIARLAKAVLGADAMEDLPRITREVCARVLVFDGFAMALYDEPTGRLRVLPGSDGELCRTARDGEPIGGSALERVVCRQRSVLDVRAAHDPAAAGEARTAPVVLTPIVTDGRLLGVLAFGARGQAHFAEHDVELVEAFAELVAPAILNIRSLEERDLSEQALRVERARLEYVFAQSPNFMAVAGGRELTIELANRAYEKLVGRSDVVGRTVREAVPELEGQAILDLLEHVGATGEPFVGEEVPVVLNRNGEGIPEERFISFVLKPRIEPDGTISGVVTHGMDVTAHVSARREAERAATEARLNLTRLQAVLEALPVGVCITDTAGRVLLSNVAAARIWGRTPQHIGSACDDGCRVFRPDAREPLAAVELPVARALRTGEAVLSEELEVEAGDGERRTILASGLLYRTGSEIVGGIWVDVEISARKRAERALRESEARLALALHAAGQGLWDWNVATGHCFFSPEALRILHLEACEAEPHIRSWERLLHPDDAAEVRRAVGACLADDVPLLRAEYRLRTGSGAWKWVAVRGNVVERDADGAPLRMTGVIVDISARRAAQDALRESEERYRAFFENDISAVYVYTPDGRIVASNPAFARMLGFESAERALGADVAALYADGSPLDETLAQLRAEGRITRRDVELRGRDGRSVRVIEHLVGRLGDDGTLQQINGYLIDITERVLLEAQLRQSQKMEAVGRLAGGVAHDFNNLLTTILGNLQLISDEHDPADAMQADLDEIRKAADRASALTRQLLAFSRQQVLSPRVLNLNDVLANTRKMLCRLLGEDIEVTTALDPDLGRVRADPGQLEQVLMNLVVNARDAMPFGGKLHIETAVVDLSGELTQQFDDLVAGRYMMIAVSDTGEGMSAEVKKQIFEPFFTTKPVGKGTGLGMSMVYGIVKQSNGYIWVYSEVGIGTTVRIYLPETTEAAAPAAAARPTRGRPHGVETVLIVEDEPVVRATAGRALRQVGYAVLEAASGAEAGRICAEYAGVIDLLLTDVIMPGASGRQVAEETLRLRPEVRVLYMSGYTADIIAKHGVLEAGVAYLQKPFTPTDLAVRVREVLDAE